MKYYAVTDDPRELYHYGVKGMKWGQHLFGDDLRPKSKAYKRVASKLKSLMGKTAKAAKTTAAQISYNHRNRQENKYQRAVQKAQRRIAITENLYNVDQDKQIYDQINKSQRELYKRNKQSDRNQKAVNKLERRYEKNEAKMDKYIQQARQGKLKYGQLSDDQVQRVQDRLMLESQARKLGSAEKTWKQQKKEARRAGYLSGITKGTAAAMEEVARAGATYGIQHLMDRKKLKAKAKFEGKEDRIKNQAKNKKTHKDINNEVKQEAYEARVREGEGIIKRNNVFKSSTKQQAKRLQEIENTKLDRVRQRKLKEAAEDHDRDRQLKIKESAEDHDREKYQKFLDEVGGSDEENRSIYANSLDPIEAIKFKDLPVEQQRARIVDAHNRVKQIKEENEKVEKEQKERQKQLNEARAEAVKRYNQRIAWKKLQKNEQLSFDDILLLKEAGLLQVNGGGNKGKKNNKNKGNKNS